MVHSITPMRMPVKTKSVGTGGNRGKAGKSIFAKVGRRGYNKRMKKQKLVEYFGEVEISQKYNRYFCRVPEAISMYLTSWQQHTS